MKRINNVFYIKAKVHKVDLSSGFLKKIFAITKWINKRYGIESDDVDFDHSFQDDDKKNNLITIRLTFNEK